MASIYKQGRIYWIQYYHNGKRFNQSLKTKDRNKAKYLKAKKESELVEKPHHVKLIDVKISHALEFYKDQNKHLKGDNTILNDYIRLRDFITFANAQSFEDIKESVLRNYLLFRLDNKSKEYRRIGIVTANNIIRTVKTFLNWSVSQNLLAYNSLLKFKQYKEPAKKQRFLTQNEVNHLLETTNNLNTDISNRYYPSIVTAIYTGMRFGELVRLKWEDIDFEKDIVTVNISKTGKFRDIPLSEKLKTFLITIQASPNELCFDFTNMHGLSRIIEDCKLEDINWKTFRHTFASLLLQAGVSIYKVAQWMGHSTARTTEIYGHLQPTNDKDINRL